MTSALNPKPGHCTSQFNSGEIFLQFFLPMDTLQLFTGYLLSQCNKNHGSYEGGYNKDLVLGMNMVFWRSRVPVLKKYMCESHEWQCCGHSLTSCISDQGNIPSFPD